MNCPMGLQNKKLLEYYLSFFHKRTNECKVPAEFSNSYHENNTLTSYGHSFHLFKK